MQFGAMVQNDPTNKGVTWSVSAGTGGGCTDAACGVIDATGKYTAPTTAHDSPGLLVVAKSVADPSKADTAVVFVTPAPTGVAVSPASVTVPIGGVQQFAATGNPFGTVPVVSWSVSGSACNGVECGTIDSTGKYTAPPIAPNPPLVTVTATSVANTSIAGSATVMLESNSDNSKLNGHYAFLLGGYDGDGNVAMAGSFIADGNGNITNGVADYNFSSGIFVATNLAFTGTYSISADNRGSMTITVSSANAFTSGFSQTFAFALGSFSGGIADRGRIIELDNEQILTTGLLAKQDPVAFSPSAIAGDYAFGFAGTASSGFALHAIGRFTVGGGSVNAGLADVYGLGLSESGSGTVSAGLRLPFAGVYQVSASGRGTAAFAFSGQDPGFSKFSFYVVSASELLFIETDTCDSGLCTFKGGISGEALQQSGGPFTAGSLNGSVVFNLTASNRSALAGSVAVGMQTFDGVGNFTGIEDQNNNGVITSNKAFSGIYEVDTDGLGRGEISLAGNQQPSSFYLISPGKAFIADTASYEAGMLETQSAEPFGSASISGDFVFGTLPWAFNWVFSPVTGVVTADGSGGLLGTSDSVAGSDANFSGSYSVAGSGRTAMTIAPLSGSPSNWVFYLISPSKAVGIDIGAGTTNSAIRIIEK
ncbi:MAG TPA: hypothetical protein VGU90_16925 [Terriglobales bacterium]|nr:hypothetical protein [Terriglobales bacterium]